MKYHDMCLKELWIETFNDVLPIALEGVPSTTTDSDKEKFVSTEIHRQVMIDRVGTAARVADEVVKEIGFRFWDKDDLREFVKGNLGRLDKEVEAVKGVGTKGKRRVPGGSRHP